MRRHSLLYLVLGIGLLTPTGCAQLSPTAMGLEIGSADAGARKSTTELAPREAARANLAVADSLEKGGQFREAALQLELARQKDPSLAHVCRRLAVLYDRLGNFAKADEEYQKALALTPNDFVLLNNIGYSYYCRGRWDDAERYLRKSLEQKPDFDRAWVNLGLTLGQQRKYPESLEAFQKAAPNAPAQAFCNLAFVLTTQGEFDSAKAAYREALKLDPSLSLAQAAMAKLERKGAPVPTKAASHGSPADARRLAASRPQRSAAVAPQQNPSPSQPARPDLTQPFEMPDPFAHRHDPAPASEPTPLSQPRTWSSEMPAR